LQIRPATYADWPAIWGMLRPVFRAGETYAVDRDITESAARALWLDAPAATYIAHDDAICLRQTRDGSTSSQRGLRSETAG
jgi:hypothetical protein